MGVEQERLQPESIEVIVETPMSWPTIFPWYIPKRTKNIFNAFFKVQMLSLLTACDR